MDVWTIYPRGWYERSVGRGKQHAFASAQPPYSGQMATSFCGVRGRAVEVLFTATTGNALTCGKCARELARRSTT